MLKAQIIQTNSSVCFVVTNTDNGNSASIQGMNATSLPEAQAVFKTYLDAVKRSRMLERTLEGDFTTGKTKNSEEDREENVQENKERMALHLGLIYQPEELPVIRGGLARIQSECLGLLGSKDYERVMNARRNVPKLAEELLIVFETASVSVVELKSVENSSGEEEIKNRATG